MKHARIVLNFTFTLSATLVYVSAILISLCLYPHTAYSAMCCMCESCLGANTFSLIYTAHMHVHVCLCVKKRALWDYCEACLCCTQQIPHAMTFMFIYHLPGLVSVRSSLSLVSLLLQFCQSQHLLRLLISTFGWTSQRFTQSISIRH